MKNINIKYSTFVIMFLLAIGCETNEDDLVQDYVTGAVFPEITEVNSSFFDILDVIKNIRSQFPD